MDKDCKRSIFPEGKKTRFTKADSRKVSSTQKMIMVTTINKRKEKKS